MKNIFKRIALLGLGLISLAIYIIFCGYINAPGIDYTNEYVIYQDIHKLTSLAEVEAYLCNKNISYKIKESILILPDYDDIEYLINPDNSSGYIKYSELHHNLSRLDERDSDIVIIMQDFVNNEPTETIYLEDNGLTYTKINDKYYIEPTLIYSIVIIISFFASHVFLISITLILIDDLITWIKKKKEVKKSVDTPTETPSNDLSKS